MKTPLYARHGIPEDWIVNLVEKQIEVHREPDSERRIFNELQTLSEDFLALACFPDVALDGRERLD